MMAVLIPLQTQFIERTPNSKNLSSVADPVTEHGRVPLSPPGAISPYGLLYSYIERLVVQFVRVI